jgi:DNA-binding transcriptional MocR family regulator
VELPGNIDSLELYRRALQHGIAIAPGPIFSAKQRCRNFIRLNCGIPWCDRVENAMQTLCRLIHGLNG